MKNEKTIFESDNLHFQAIKTSSIHWWVYKTHPLLHWTIFNPAALLIPQLQLSDDDEIARYFSGKDFIPNTTMIYMQLVKLL